MPKDNHFGAPFQDDLNSVTKYPTTPKKKGRLPKAKPLRPSKPVVSRGAATGGAASTGGGIASPLSEVGPRSYGSPNTLISSDGLFVIVYQPLSTTTFTDGNGDPVKVNYLDG